MSEDVPVSAAIVAIADSVGLATPRDPAQFMSEMVRVVYTRPQTRDLEILAPLRNQARLARSSGAASFAVPIPLTSEVWSRAVFRHTVPSSEMVPTILLDRSAGLLCYGLSALDDETLQYLSEHSSILTQLYENDTPIFAAFSGGLRIRADRVVPPGGSAAVSLWESAVGESVDRPDRFIRALFSTNDGRLAYLYDRIAQLDQPHATFALGLWVRDAGLRTERFSALVAAVSRNYREWHLRDLPFSRPLNDFAFLMMRLEVEPSGEPAPPAARTFWDAVFQPGDSQDLLISAGSSEDRDRVDAAFLTEITGTGDMYWRGDRIDQVSLGQRMFARVPENARRDAIATLQAFPRHRMLIWTLERMGITAPAVYAAALRQASDVASGDPNRAFWTLTELQGALALVARMRLVETIDVATAERLVMSVCAVRLTETRRYGGGIAQWMASELLPLLPPGDRVEERLIAGVSGPSKLVTAPRVIWEGQLYRLDFASAEARRLRAVREKQGGYSVDFAFDLQRVARTLASEAITLEDIRSTATSLGSLIEEAMPRSMGAEPEILVAGVQTRPVREGLTRTVEELTRIGRGREPKRATRLAAPLVDMADTVLSEALLSLVYAMDLGDPDGPALLASNVALRHDFGFALHESESRVRRAWDVPRQDLVPGMPWRVSGSLLGLDIALAPLKLRRASLDRAIDVPRLPPNEREAFAVGTALMNPRSLRDADLEAIVTSIARGRAKIVQLSATDRGIGAVADALALDGRRRRDLAWTAANRPADLITMFSLAELMMLGGGAPGADLDAWGMSAFYSRGCACTQMLTPGRWPLLVGRPQLALLSSIVADLNLRVAVVLSELRLPAGLERPVLAAAVQDFIYEVAPSDAGDWLTVARAAQAVPRQRIEDYVAAAAAVDGPLIPVDALNAASQP